MEICVRYCAFFEANSQFIPAALEKFVNFIHHDHIKVKTRSWYLFFRFTKSLRHHLGNIAENIVLAVKDLLPIKAELPDENSDHDDMSSDESDQSASARFNSQLHLYEAIGCICSAHAVPVESQVLYVRSIITPLFSDLEAHLGQAKAGDERSALQVHHLIMALGTLARGFSDWTPNKTSSTTSPPAEAISVEFSRAAGAILVALESLNASFDIRTAARFAFSRFVGVLGHRILDQLPRWIDGLLSQTSSKDEMALFLRLLDQVIFGFNRGVEDILNTLLTPFLNRVFTGMNEPTAGTDDEIQLQELKREFLGFLLILLNNGLESTLVSQTNQAAFENVISTIASFTKDTSDYPTAKLAFSVLTRMVMTWGGPDAHGKDLNSGNSNPQPRLPGFTRFMIETFSPLSWALPSNTNFNSKDAQAKQALGEAATLQQGIYMKSGNDYLTWLRDVELRNMGMGDAGIQEYLNALCSMELKEFRQFFQVGPKNAVRSWGHSANTRTGFGATN